MDDLRRLLGLSKRGSKSARHEKTDRDVDAAEPRYPELAPGSVEILGGRTTITGVALRVSLVVVGVLLALVLAYQLLGLILLVVVAMIIAAAMYQPANALERRGLPRAVALVLTYLSLLAMVALLAVFIAGPLVSEVERLIENGPGLLTEIRDQAVGFLDGLAGDGAGDDIVQAIQGALGQLELGRLVEVPLAVAGGLVDIILILFLSAFLVLERDRAERWLLPLLPSERRQATRDLGAAVFRRLGRFVHGQLLVMTLVGLGMFAGLVVLGVPFALPLSLFAFLVEAIPMIGPWIAIIPALIVALAESPTQALLLVGWWFIVQQLEGYLLTPAVMGKVQHLSGTVVLLSVLAGFELFGVLGAVIAVPVVAAMSMIVEAVVRPARERAVETPTQQQPSGGA